MGEMPKTLLELGYRASRERRLAEAKAHFAEAVEQSRKAGEKTWLAPSLVGLGKIERDLQESDAALKHYQDAVQVYRTLDEPLALAHTIRHVGDILRNRKQLDRPRPVMSKRWRSIAGTRLLLRSTWQTLSGAMHF